MWIQSFKTCHVPFTCKACQGFLYVMEILSAWVQAEKHISDVAHNWKIEGYHNDLVSHLRKQDQAFRAQNVNTDPVNIGSYLEELNLPIEEKLLKAARKQQTVKGNLFWYSEWFNWLDHFVINYIIQGKINFESFMSIHVDKSINVPLEADLT